MNKYICIHGHFYQPPRENPWLEAVELQDSASPYHDWNERITAECYGPNAHARLLDGERRIQNILNNYSRMSFNFGPTLLAWMKSQTPEIHEAIVTADHESQKRFSGHGAALAQCYNHLIMPLANRRDKYTQVAWGIHDFQTRFGRFPEGMWLSETAADNETLDVLAELGIKFTILSPFQASRTRALDNGDWQDVNGGKVDPSIPYRVNLPSGRSISVFFYDGPVAQAVAFEHLIQDGGRLVARLKNAFSDARAGDQLVHIATDGESYGHHHRYGEMALAYALNALEADDQVKLTIYGEYLESHPPRHEAEIHQPSAWSCPHGVDRWKRNCGCNSGMKAGWNQEWRAPLREALDWLRDEVAPGFEEHGRQFLKDPWNARNDYIKVICDRSSESIARFFDQHGARKLSEEDQITSLRLLEMQRHALLMYTSCGWFFDDLSGIETVQVIQYAARVIQLGNDLLKADLEPGFCERLANARSNLPENGNGRDIYRRFVKPSIMTQQSVGAHFAVSSLFRSYPEQARIYSFNVKQEDRHLFVGAGMRVAVGRIRVTFDITRNSSSVVYAALHLGELNVSCGVRAAGDSDFYVTMVKELAAAVAQSDSAAVIRLMDRHFGEISCSLETLFRDEQRSVLDQILGSTHQDTFNLYKLLTERHAPLMRLLSRIGATPPKSLKLAMEFVLNTELRTQFEKEVPERERIGELLAECEATGIALDRESIRYAIQGYLDRATKSFLEAQDNPDLLKQLIDTATWIRKMPFEVNTWSAQNAYFVTLTHSLSEMRQRADSGDEAARKWVEGFLALGEALGFRVERAAA